MSNTGERKGSSNNNTKIIIAVFAVVVIALVGLVVYLLARPDGGTQVVVVTPTPAPNFYVGMSAEEIEALRQKQTEDAARNNIIVSMPTSVTFENGKAEGSIKIENVPENIFPFMVEYFLEDGKSVLKTGLIAPGYTLEEQKLDVELPKGTYSVSAIYTTFDVDGYEVGKVGVSATFIVKN